MSRKAQRVAFLAAIAAPLLIAAAGCAHPGENMRAFYAPSESMAPTFLTGDRFMARMGRPASLSRGDVVLVDAPMGGIYITRIAGLPGDWIEMVDGIVHLNGRAVGQRFIRMDRVEPGPDGDAARRLAEQFPGETAPHEIYDSGRSPGDDVPRQMVAPGRLFLLGDNRDHSNDSRFPARDTASSRCRSTMSAACRRFSPGAATPAGSAGRSADSCGRNHAPPFRESPRAPIVRPWPPPTSPCDSSPATRCSKGRWSPRRSPNRRSGSIFPPRR